jgi:uncharacterized membrane protein
MPKSPETTGDEIARAADLAANGHVTEYGAAGATLSPPSPAEAVIDRPEPPRISLLAIGIFCVVLTGFLLRFAAAQQLSSHVDESASVMAAQMVADKGVPVFPSGTLYLQGATISYLLAPLIKLGYGDFGDFDVLRMLSVIAGTLAIVAAYALTKWLTRSQWTALGVAALLAIDPASVRWGGMVRMYALLQFVSLVMLFLFLHLLRSPGSRRLVAGFIVAFWFGVFTHIAICLFLPAMLGLAVWKHRLALIGRRIDLTIALAGACAAPFTLLALNRLVTPPRATPSGTSSGMSFVGDYLISVEQIIHPTLQSWQLLFDYATSGGVLPYLIAGLTCLLIGRYFLDTDLPAWKTERRGVLGVLLLLYWPPILAVAAFATEANERYLLHLHPLGLMLVGFAVQEFISGERAQPAMQFAPAQAGTMTVAGLPVDLAGARIGQRLQWLTVSRVYAACAATTIALGAALRLWGYNRLSLWLDEGFSLLYSKQSWSTTIGLDGFYSPHPTLYFTLIKVANLVLSDATAGRAVAVLCGVLAVPVFFMLARRILEPTAALIATLVFTLSPIHIYYSQEARMYSLVVLAVTTSFLALVAYLQTLHRGWAVLYGLSLAVAVYADYSSLFVLGPQAAALAIQVWRYRRRTIPLIIAGGAAAIAYLPWLPQVWDSVNSANEDERRADYLGAGFKRIMTIVLRITGISSDSSGAYFPSLEETPWDRLHAIQPAILLVMAPVVALGIAGLWKRWTALAVVGAFFGCIVVAVIASLASPGFAERTILSAVVGWALLLGAAFNGPINRQRTPLAAISLLAVLGLCLGTIQNIHESAIKQRWDDAVADLTTVSTTDFPVITYSYGAVADTLVEAYEPGLLGSMRVITVRDGELERTLSNDVIPRKGITIKDVNAGKFAELLPNTPENDLVWFLYYTRRGEEIVRAGIGRAGYSRIIYTVYDAPRGQVFLSLYARPGADLGASVGGIPDFSQSAEWGIPAGFQLVRASDDGSSVSVTNQSNLGTAVAAQIKTDGEALYTVDVDFQTRLRGSSALVTLTCLTQAGGVLNELTAPSPDQPINGVRRHQSGIYCPEETEQLRVTLRNSGAGEITFFRPALRTLPVPDR